MIWILVAHRSDARLFKSTGKRNSLSLIREFDYPDGRRQNREIDTDGKGSRYSSSAGRGNASHGNAPSSQMKHGLDPQLEAAEHIADIFAKELATILRDGRTHNEYNELIIVAEAGFLGKLRKFIDKETNKLISETVNRNLNGLSESELASQLEELVFSTRKVA